MTTKMKKALEYMNSIIQIGAEYPDALWQTARQFKVKMSELKLAYDAQ